MVDTLIRLLQKDDYFKPDDVIATDAPWDVAWYGDRTAVWLPGSLSQFKDYLQAGAASIIQVDVARIGGITPWLKVAHMAESAAD